MRFQDGRVGNVVLKGVLGADLLLFAIRIDGTVVYARCTLPYPMGVSTEQRPEHGVRGHPELLEGTNRRTVGSAPTKPKSSRSRSISPIAAAVSPARC